MQLTIDLPEDFLPQNEIDDLNTIFGTSNDEFIPCVQKIAIAALAEYKQMLLGIDLPSRADEIRQHRLLHLIKHFYVNRIPNEAEVSMIFQLPEVRSRSLIVNTMSRFRHELNMIIEQTLKQLILTARPVGEGLNFEVEIQSKFALDELNRLIQRRAPLNQKIYAKADSAGVYIIPSDTMGRIRQILKIEE